MALDPRIEPLVSPLTERHFPEAYREAAPLLVDFVTTYFQWLESDGEPNYHARRLLDYGDIDATVDMFLPRFREKYLPGIQLQPATDARLLVKHCLDLYRSRGSTRAVDLFFRLVFGVGADVYFPGVDVFRLSAGDWTIPTYLEVAPGDGDLSLFVGKFVVGVFSGATAFVERVVRRLGPSRLIYQFYLSALENDFQTGELVTLRDSQLEPGQCPLVVGSLTSLQVISGGQGFDVGDTLDLSGALGGYRAKGVVSAIQEVGGSVTFTLEDGGYGYTTNAQVLVAGQNITVAGISPGPNLTTLGGIRRDYLLLFETLRQPLANISYVNANGAFANSGTITSYFVNNSVQGTGTVLSISTTNTTAGTLLVGNLSGNLNVSAIYTTGNLVTANLSVISGYADVSATGNVIGESTSSTITLSGVSGSFVVGEQVQQVVSSTTTCLATVTSFSSVGGVGTLEVSSREGIVDPTQPISGVSSGASASITSVQVPVGLISVAGSFLLDSRAPVLGLQSGTTGTALLRTTGTILANCSVGGITLPEFVSLGTDFVSAYAADNLNAASWAFPAFPTANLATLLGTALAFVNTEIGVISSLTAINPGADYSGPPIVRVLEPLTAQFGRRDEALGISGATTSFAPGELVTGATSSSRGLVRSANSSAILMKRLSLFSDFVVGESVSGSNTGAVATVTADVPDASLRVLDIQEDVLGVDAMIQTQTLGSANGVAAEVSVLDSGLGFVAGELVSFVSESGAVGTAQAELGQQGVGTGFYQTEGGFLSDGKHLYDGFYYQDFSYEVRTSLTLDKYAAALKQMLHVAGTQAFGAYYLRTTAPATLGVDPAGLQVATSTSANNADPIPWYPAIF